MTSPNTTSVQWHDTSAFDRQDEGRRGRLSVNAQIGRPTEDNPASSLYGWVLPASYSKDDVTKASDLARALNHDQQAFRKQLSKALRSRGSTTRSINRACDAALRTHVKEQIRKVGGADLLAQTDIKKHSDIHGYHRQLDKVGLMLYDSLKDSETKKTMNPAASVESRWGFHAHPGYEEPLTIHVAMPDVFGLESQQGSEDQAGDDSLTGTWSELFVLIPRQLTNPIALEPVMDAAGNIVWPAFNPDETTLGRDGKAAIAMTAALSSAMSDPSWRGPRVRVQLSTNSELESLLRDERKGREWSGMTYGLSSSTAAQGSSISTACHVHDIAKDEECYWGPARVTSITAARSEAAR